VHLRCRLIVDSSQFTALRLISRDLSDEIHSHNNEEGADRTLQDLQNYHEQKGLIFVNRIYFDMV
jgi:phosphopentomutase